LILVNEYPIQSGYISTNLWFIKTSEEETLNSYQFHLIGYYSSHNLINEIDLKCLRYRFLTL